MVITINKKTLIRFFLILGCFISVMMIFCFCGNAVEQVISESEVLRWGKSSLFDFAFGNEYTYRSPGVLVLFILQISLMVIAIAYLSFLFIFKSKKKILNIMSFVILIFLTITIIMGFLTKTLVRDAYIAGYIRDFHVTREEAIRIIDEIYYRTRLSVGSISYISLGFIAFASIGVGTILNNIERRD